LRVFFELLLGSSSAADAAAAAIFSDCQNWPVIPLESGGEQKNRGARYKISLFSLFSL
jgi:hypothetical protein